MGLDKCCAPMALISSMVYEYSLGRDNFPKAKGLLAERFKMRWRFAERNSDGFSAGQPRPCIHIDSRDNNIDIGGIDCRLTMGNSRWRLKRANAEMATCH